MRLAKPVTTASGQVLLTAGTALKESFLEPLKRHGIAAVYVINDLAPDVEPQDVVSAETRQALLSELGRVLGSGARQGAGATRLGGSDLAARLEPDAIRRSTERLVDEILSNPQVVYNLQDIRTADEYTLGHSVNVCILSVLLGTVLGYNRVELNDLATGSLLHDIGKVLTPPEILNKPGALTPEEFVIMTQHTTNGWRMLIDQHVRPTAAIIALQHHERWLGGGYPRNTTLDSIHRFARVCAVADCFDAMTADRVYRKGMSPARAIHLMQTSMKGFFQPGLVPTFVQCIAPYPIGSLVEITGGYQAVVVDVSRNQTDRPRIRVVLDPRGAELPEQVEYDLQERMDINILRVIRDEAEEAIPSVPD